MKRVGIGILATIAAGLLIAAGTARIIKISAEDLRYYPGAYSRASRTGSGTVTAHGIQPVNVNGWGVYGNNTAAEAESLVALVAVVDGAGGGDIYFPKPITAYLTTGVTVSNAKTRLTGFVPAGIVGGAPRDIWGTGSPEGVYTAPVGSIYRSDQTGAGDIYVKKSGTSNTGWILVTGAGEPGTTGDVTVPVLTSINPTITCNTTAILAVTATSDERAYLVMRYKRGYGGSWSSADTVKVYGKELSGTINTLRSCSYTDTFYINVAAVDSAGNCSSWYPGGLALNQGGQYPSTLLMTNVSTRAYVAADDSIYVSGGFGGTLAGVATSSNAFVQGKHNYNGSWIPAYSQTSNWTTVGSTSISKTASLHLKMSSCSCDGDTFYVRVRGRLASGDTTATPWNTASGVPYVVRNVVSNGVTGTASYDSVLTISGSGFGTKTVAAPLASDTFESYTNGTFAGSIQAGGSPFSYLGRSSSNISPTVVATCPTGRTGKSMRFIQYQAATQPLAYQRQVLYLPMMYPTTSRYYTFDAWLYADDAAHTGQQQYKAWGFSHDLDWADQVPGFIDCFWNYTADQSGWTAGMLEHWPAGAIVPHSTSGGLSSRTWQHVQAYIDVGSIGGSLTLPYDGSIRILRNGRSAINSPAKFYPSSVDPTRGMYMYFGGYVMAATSGGTTAAYWDDVYFDNSWARVELGNASTYADCSHLEVQIPTSWSDSQVSATCRPGSFAAGDQVWVFVTNSSGQTSAGYGPVVIGDSATPPPPVGSAITLSSLTSKYTCSNDSLYLRMTATGSESNLRIVTQYKNSEETVWTPTWNGADTTGTSAKLATSTSISKEISRSGSCSQYAQGQGDAVFNCRVIAYSNDLARVSTVYNLPDITVPITPSYVSQQYLNYSIKNTDSLLVTTTPIFSGPVRYYSQFRLQTTGAPDTALWRPFYSPSANWSASGSTVSQTHRAKVPAVTGSGTIHTRIRSIYNALNDTTVINQDTGDLTVAAATTYKYYITRRYPAGMISSFTDTVGYIVDRDTTQTKRGFMSMVTGSADVAKSGNNDAISTGTNGIWRIQACMNYFGTKNLSNFLGSTVSRAYLHVYGARNTNQTSLTPSDTLFFVGADSIPGITVGATAINQINRNYMVRGTTTAWPDLLGRGTDPIGWIDFTAISSLSMRSLSESGKASIGNTYIYDGTEYVVDVTEFYQSLADGKRNGGIWYLSRGKSGLSYAFYSHESPYNQYIHYENRRPVLEIIYTK